MTRLKPCPFCGGAGEIKYQFGNWYVKCKVCHVWTNLMETENAAILLWNRRVKE